MCHSLSFRIAFDTLTQSDREQHSYKRCSQVNLALPKDIAGEAVWARVRPLPRPFMGLLSSSRGVPRLHGANVATSSLSGVVKSNWAWRCGATLIGEGHVFPRGMFYLFQAKGGSVRAAIEKEQFKWSYLTSQRLLVITRTRHRV